MRYLASGICTEVAVIELDKTETLDALDKTRSRGIQGARVYDYLHALASEKARAEELLTRNPDDFQGLVDKIEWP